MPKHKLLKRDLLEYALSGARTELGVSMGNISDEVIEELEADIAEIERRIKLMDRAYEILGIK